MGCFNSTIEDDINITIKRMDLHKRYYNLSLNRFHKRKYANWINLYSTELNMYIRRKAELEYKMINISKIYLINIPKVLHNIIFEYMCDCKLCITDDYMIMLWNYINKRWECVNSDYVNIELPKYKYKYIYKYCSDTIKVLHKIL